MDLNIFNNLDNTINKKTQENIEELKEMINQETAESKDNEILDLNENRKEGHLYLVTEDRNGEVYLWDYTEKSEVEFVETDLTPEVLEFAKEGTMLKFEEGKYILYSPYGYDIVDSEEEV